MPDINVKVNVDDSELTQVEKRLGKGSKVNIDAKINDDGSIKQTTANIQNMSTATQKSNSIFGTLKAKISDTFSSARLATTAFLTSLYSIQKASKSAVTTIKDINASITALRMATNENYDSVSKLVQGYNQMGKNLGAVTTEVSEGADAWLRQGHSVQNTNKLIKDTMMLSKVAKIDSAVSTEYLTSAMKGYGVAVEDVSKIVDKLTSVDLVSATDAGGLAEAMSRTAVTADMAGISMDRLLGYLAVTGEVTQKSMSSIGESFKTIFTRMSDIKSNKLELVDEDGTTELLSDVELTLSKVGIDLRKTVTEYNNYGDVLDDLASKWDSLNQVQQNALSKAFAGTRQAENFRVLMENYDSAIKYMETAANSAGTAEQKFGAYLDSIEAKTKSLQAAFEAMVINSDFSETYSGILDTTTALVEFIDQANVLKGVFAGLTVSSGIKFFLAAKTGATEAYISLNKFANALDIVKQTNISTTDFDKLLLLSNGLSASQMKLLLSSKQLSMAQKEQILINSGLSSEEAKLQLQTWGMVTAQTGLTAATTTLGNAFKGLMASMAANPIMLATLAVSGAVMAYQSYNQKLEETRQKNIEASEAAIEHAKSLQDLYNEYNRLSSIQNRTTTEEEDFKTAVEGITKALGDKAEVLEGLTAGTNEYADALAKVTKEELQSASVNATVGRKSAEEELQGNIWSDWSGSKVSVDSNSKGKALSEEAQKAVDIVSDALKDFETVNRTWNNLSWDISSNDPKEALEYFNALTKAREELVLASENDEALLDTEVYKDMNVAINAMSESLDSYIEKLYEEEKLLYMSQNSIPSTTEEYKAMEEVMVNVAGSSVDLQEKFKELLTTDFASLVVDVENVGSAVEDVVNATAAMNPDLTASASKIIDQLNTQLKPAFDSLKSAYKDIFSDDGFNLDAVDIPMLESIKSDIEELNNLEDVDISINMDDFNNFAKILTDVNTTEEQAHQAFDDLATSIFNATTATEGMTDETVKLVEQLLESLGVVNATEVAEQALMESKAQTVLATYDLINATENEYVAILAEGEAAGVTRQAIYSLMAAEIAFGQNDLSVEQKISKLKELATAYGDTASAALATAIANDLASGHTDVDTAINDLMAKINAGINKVDIDFGNIGGGTSGASKAAKSHADAYLDAFQQEYDHLKDLLNRGEISESQYLNSLRALYIRYFADRKEYLDEFKKYESEYINGMVSLHNKALSGISTLLNKRISAANESKSAVIDALNEEREAAAEVYQSQIDAIEEQKKAIDNLIKQKQKQIDAINEEIDRIEKAAEARKKNIDLQQQEYNLQKMLNQRTTAVYKEGQGFVWETDTTGIRDAREKVTEAKEAIQIDNLKNEISLIQKEIDLLDEKKNVLSEQQEQLQKMMDESNKYYDNLIKEQEKYWDSIIKNFEHNKSRWEELAEVEEIAKAFSYIQQVFGDLGYTVEDVLNGSDAAFEDFKSRYISLMSDMNSNTSFAEGLSYASGVAKEDLGSFLDKTQEVSDGLDTLGSKATELDSVADSMDRMGTSATALGESTEGLNTNLEGISDSLANIPDSEGFSDWITAFESLGEAIKKVSDALGIGEEGTVGGLVGALQSLSTLSIGSAEGEAGGIVSQFNELKTAVDAVTAAISGGGSGSSGGDASTSSSPSMSAGASGEGASGLTGAIEAMKKATDEALGSGSEEGADGEGSGAIGQFEQLKTAVDDVSAAIGSGSESGSGSGSGGEDTDDLIGAINNLGETTEEILVGDGENGGESGGVIGRFEEFKDVIGEANEHVHSISDGLDEIDGKEVECTIRINIETSGGLPAGLAHATGTALDTMNLESGEYNAKYGAAHVEGTALVQGNWAVQSEEKNALLAEIGPEIVVRNGRYHVIGLNGAEMFNIKPGDIVFNAEQSAALLKYGKISGRGKAYADGTVGDKFASGVLRPLQEGDRAYELQKKMTDYMARTGEDVHSLLSPVNTIQRDMEKMTQSINTISNIDNSNRMQNITQEFHITMPNITDSTTATELMKDLQSLGTKKMQFFDSRF